MKYLDERKCECGHTNPVGTLICESCGKPLEAAHRGEQAQTEAQTAFPDMRYEGMARRSQTYSSTLIDKVWNFFSSVKIAVVIIIITLIMSGVGTIFPQQRYIPVPVPTENDVRVFYADTYGTPGEIYYLFGFHNMYDSWWFVTLLVMIGTSLVICSLDRIIPLYKALSKPRVKQHLSFIKGQKLRGETAEGQIIPPEEIVTQASQWLKKKGYNVYQEGDVVLGEKARFSRWGPYVNHIGLILFLLGVLLRSVPGFYLDDFVWVREGQTVAVPGTPYYVTNLEYKTEYYSEDEFAEELPIKEGEVIPKNFQTDAILYVNANAALPGAKPQLKEVLRGPIVVNHPLTYEGISLYQSGKKEMNLGALNFTILDRKAGNKPVGPIKVDLYEPAAEQTPAEGVTVRVLDYYPDFYMDENGKPATKTSIPNNPMIAMEIVTGNIVEKLVYVAGGILTQAVDPRFTLAIQKPDFIDITGLMVRKDTMIPLIYAGFFVSLIGMVMGFYWQHRRIWFHIEAGRLYVAGHTNKNWFGLHKEVKFLIEKIGIPVATEVHETPKKKPKKEVHPA